MSKHSKDSDTSPPSANAPAPSDTASKTPKPGEEVSAGDGDTDDNFGDVNRGGHSFTQS